LLSSILKGTGGVRDIVANEVDLHTTAQGNGWGCERPLSRSHRDCDVEMPSDGFPSTTLIGGTKMLRHDRMTALGKCCDSAAAYVSVGNPPMPLKKSLLQCGKSFDSLSNEGIGGFRDDGDAIDTCAVVL
jgi:hypothetical protein